MEQHRPRLMIVLVSLRVDAAADNNGNDDNDDNDGSGGSNGGGGKDDKDSSADMPTTIN